MKYFHSHLVKSIFQGFSLKFCPDPTFKIELTRGEKEFPAPNAADERTLLPEL